MKHYFINIMIDRVLLNSNPLYHRSNVEPCTVNRMLNYKLLYHINSNAELPYMAHQQPGVFLLDAGEASPAIVIGVCRTSSKPVLSCARERLLGLGPANWQ